MDIPEPAHIPIVEINSPDECLFVVATLTLELKKNSISSLLYKNIYYMSNIPYRSFRCCFTLSIIVESGAG